METTLPRSDSKGWGTTAPGLYLLALALTCGLALSLGAGAFSAYHLSKIMAAEPSPASGIADYVFWGIRISGALIGVAQVVALGLVMGGAAPVRALAIPAFVLCTLDFLVAIALDVGWSALGTGYASLLKGVGYFDMVVALVGDGITLECLFALHRAATGTRGDFTALRVVFWVAYLARLAVGWGWGLLMGRPGEGMWLQYGLRMALGLAVTGALLLAIRAAVQALEAAPSGARPTTGPEATVEAATLIASGWKNVALGILWMAIGGGVTLFSWMSASSSSGGGRYVVAYGAVVVGFAQLVRGIVRLLSAGSALQVR